MQRRSPRGNVDWNIKSIHWVINTAVVPHAGTWIEISSHTPNNRILSSFPTRERGLKFVKQVNDQIPKCVVPHAGTWIEISSQGGLHSITWSFPTRERGLKYRIWWRIVTLRRRSPRGNVDWNIGKLWRANLYGVVPHAGTWIEIAV